MEKLGPGRWRVAGTLRLDDFRREYPALGDVPEVETMGGLLTSLLDVVPGQGRESRRSVLAGDLKLTAQVDPDEAERALRGRLVLGWIGFVERLDDHCNLLIWAVFIACLAVSFVLSGMEAGVFALSRLRIRQQMRAGQPSAKVLHDYLENPENFLWTILVGNTVANFLILGWLLAKLHEALGDHRLWFVVVFSVAVFLFYASVRPAAQDAVPDASEPAVPRAGAPVSVHPPGVAPAGGAGGDLLRTCCCGCGAAKPSPGTCSATAKSCAW